MKTNDLFQQTTCYLNGEKKSGKVIAVSTQVDRHRVCFQVKGEEIGEWVPELALTGAYATVAAKKEVKGYIHHDQSAKDQEKSKKYTGEKAQTESQEKHDIYPVAIKNDIKLNIFVEKEVKQEAEKNIHALEKFVADAQNAITNKATSDTAILVNLIKDTYTFIKSASIGIGTLVDYAQLAHEWLKQAIPAAIEVIAYIQQTLSELWSLYWRDRIIDAIKGQRPHYTKAKATVENLKQIYLYETARQIAERLIHEKAIFATVTGSLPLLVSAIPLVGMTAELIVVKFLDIQGLLVEMIYQVGVSYGFDEFEEGIYLGILDLAFPTMENIFGSLLKGSTPDLVIPSATNMIMFLVVGYAACEFYEAKAKGWVTPTDSLDAFMASQTKVKAYAEKAYAEEEAIEVTVVKAMSVKEQLVPSLG